MMSFFREILLRLVLRFGGAQLLGQLLHWLGHVHHLVLVVLNCSSCLLLSQWVPAVHPEPHHWSQDISPLSRKPSHQTLSANGTCMLVAHPGCVQFCLPLRHVPEILVICHCIIGILNCTVDCNSLLLQTFLGCNFHFASCTLKDFLWPPQLHHIELPCLQHLEELSFASKSTPSGCLKDFLDHSALPASASLAWRSLFTLQTLV